MMRASNHYWLLYLGSVLLTFLALSWGLSGCTSPTEEPPTDAPAKEEEKEVSSNPRQERSSDTQTHSPETPGTEDAASARETGTMGLPGVPSAMTPSGGELGAHSSPTEEGGVAPPVIGSRESTSGSETPTEKTTRSFDEVSSAGMPKISSGLAPPNISGEVSVGSRFDNPVVPQASSSSSSEMSRSGEETIPPDDSTQSRPDPLPTSPEDSAGDTVAVTPMENSGNPSGAGTVSEVVSKPQASLESVNPLRADEQQFGGPSPSQGGSEATSSEPPAPAGSAPGVTSSDHAEIPPSASPGAAEELKPTHRPPSESGAFSESIAPAVSGQPVARQAVPSTPYTEAAAPSPSSTPDPEETPAVETIASHTKTEAVAKEPELDYDPVAENGTFFNGWEDPRLVLVFTGCQDGYLEPCGCAGLAKMKGGLSRRYTFFEGLEKLGWPVLALDVGGLIKGFGRQAELKFQLTNEAMRQMDYDAIGLGESDLKLPAGELLTVTANMPENPSPFVSANVAVYAFDPTMTAPYKILGINGLKIGVTSVLGDHHRQAVSNPDVMMAEAEESIRDVLPKLKEARCNLLVLLSHASAKQTKDLANMFPEFRIVATADTPPEPPLKPKMINGDQYYLEVGEKGKYAVVVGIFNDEDPQKRVRYQRVALDSRYANSPEILQLMADYQAQLKADGFEGLGIRPVPLAKSELMGTFVGSRACENCHEDEYEIWEDSGHAHAWHSIVEISKPSREFDPECISCHVIGWHPTEYFPYESGFLGVKETPHLKNVGCESCHGPGEEHIKAEEHGDVATQERLREAVRLPMREAEKFCYRCHDLDNSPAFDFETYWPKVDHRLFKD